jgi:hypothetical protein
MKQFNLFITVHTSDNLKKIFESFKEEFREKAHCNPSDEITVDHAMFADSENFLEIKHVIDHFYREYFTKYIILFDNKKDIAYIYKGKGSLYDIKKNVFPPIVSIYETLRKEVACFEIEDVRITMMGFYQNVN